MVKGLWMFGLNKEIRGKHITYRPELDGIRALAIAVVLLHHLGYLNGRGFLGVDVFFTLSGYLITQVLLATVAQGKPLMGFYRRRLARLYPIMALSIPLALLLVGFQSSRDTKPALASLFYVKNFLHWGDLFGPFWSLSAEEQFYLIFPITLLIFLKFFNRRILTAFLILLTAAAWGHVLTVNYPDYSWNQDGRFNLVLFRPTMILVGCLISLNYEWCKKWVKKFQYLFLALFVLIFAITLHMQFPGLAAIDTALLILLLDKEVSRELSIFGGVRRLLSLPPIRTLGILSYSIYIWHMPIIFWYYNHALNPHEHLWAIFGLVLLAALVSFYLVEVPLQRILSGAGKSSNK
jgi:peptidoglycan/LPS O-acetylase OafA/YrhL